LSYAGVSFLATRWKEHTHHGDTRKTTLACRASTPINRGSRWRGGGAWRSHSRPCGSADGDRRDGHRTHLHWPGNYFQTPANSDFVFQQSFATEGINFDPPSAAGYCGGTAFNENRPFVDVNPTNPASCASPTIVQKDASTQAGVDNTRSASSGPNLAAFRMVLTGNFRVDAPGDVTFINYSDDGALLGIGPNGSNQPYYSGGSCTGASPNGLVGVSCGTAGDPTSSADTSAQQGYRLVGAANYPHEATGQNFTVHFPAAGVYPFELDYAENGGGGLSMTLQQAIAGNNAPISVDSTIDQGGNGCAQTGTCTNATPELGSGELLATGILPFGAALLYRRRRQRARRASQQ